ncbi:MAG TPA: signal recognition particle-docking protein FtsY [Kofleriaceae bacterium]|nr:signal recognition particle-docking protein FtsY [Kofleriaceae bacterium]
MQTELIHFGIAIVVVILVLLWLRVASKRSRTTGPTDTRARLGLEEKPEAPVRKRPVKTAKKPEAVPEAEKRKAEQEEKAEEEEVAAVTDEETAAAYKAGLAKTRGGFVARLGKLFGKKQIDAATVDELEEVLFTADIGPRAAERIFQSVKGGLSKADLEDSDKIWNQIKKTSREILAVNEKPFDLPANKPFVLLVLGVNGVGKTTTIGKLASLWKGQGKKVLLAAGDTFRAAATEQLEEWAKRAGVDIVKGKAGGDPSSVVFDAIKKGVDDSYDIVICDTAGRLHSNAGLMDELKKLRRVSDKACPGAPHETWMVLDATTGQNAISQAKTFKADMEISGIVLTKLDGTSKGGVVLGICDELKVPVRFVGLGEKITDLRPFDHKAFVEKLYERADTSEAA